MKNLLVAALVLSLGCPAESALGPGGPGGRDTGGTDETGDSSQGTAPCDTAEPFSVPPAQVLEFAGEWGPGSEHPTSDPTWMVSKTTEYVARLRRIGEPAIVAEVASSRRGTRWNVDSTGGSVRLLAHDYVAGGDPRYELFDAESGALLAWYDDGAATLDYVSIFDGLVVSAQVEADGMRGRLSVFEDPTGDLAAAQPLVTTMGTSEGEQLGEFVLPVGDLDGDGLEEVMFMAYDTTFLVTGDDFRSEGGLGNARTIDWFNSPAALPGGDLDGDGYGDWVVGASAGWAEFHSTAAVFYGASVEPAAYVVDESSWPYEDSMLVEGIGDPVGLGRDLLSIQLEDNDSDECSPAAPRELWLLDAPRCGTYSIRDEGVDITQQLANRCVVSAVTTPMAYLYWSYTPAQDEPLRLLYWE